MYEAAIIALNEGQPEKAIHLIQFEMKNMKSNEVFELNVYDLPSLDQPYTQYTLDFVDE